MAIDHAFFNALRADIDAALATIATRHGLKSLELGRITIDAMGGFRGAVEGIRAGELSPEERGYNTLRAYSDNVLPELGAEFTLGAQRWRVVGQKLRGNQRVIAEKIPQGGRFLLPVATFESRFPARPVVSS